MLVSYSANLPGDIFIILVSNLFYLLLLPSSLAKQCIGSGTGVTFVLLPFRVYRDAWTTRRLVADTASGAGIDLAIPAVCNDQFPLHLEARPSWNTTDDAYAGVGEDTVIYYVYDRGIRPEENPQ